MGVGWDRRGGGAGGSRGRQGLGDDESCDLVQAMRNERSVRDALESPNVGVDWSVAG